MSAILAITRAGPLTSIQDEGRFGMLRHGISASGPMDRGAYAQAFAGGYGGIEITMAGVEFRITSGDCRLGFAGGDFKLALNGKRQAWPGHADLATGDVVAVTPGRWGNYGYLRFGGDIVAQPVMGSIATSSRARLGGLNGRALQVGDVIELAAPGALVETAQGDEATPAEGPIRVVWGLHVDMFPAALREKFVGARFTVSARLDRMGVRLEDAGGVFSGATILSLVSDATSAGDIQILGDGTPIVLMRDHQPTGGYPRIATVITADLDRFAQLRPGTAVEFTPVTVEHAHRLLRSRT